MKYILNTGRYALSFEIEKGGLKKTIVLDRRRLYNDTGNVATTGVTAIEDDDYKLLSELEIFKKRFADKSCALSLIDEEQAMGKPDPQASKLAEENKKLKEDLKKAKEEAKQAGGDTEAVKKLEDENASLKAQLENYIDEAYSQVDKSFDKSKLTKDIDDLLAEQKKQFDEGSDSLKEAYALLEKTDLTIGVELDGDAYTLSVSGKLPYEECMLDIDISAKYVQREVEIGRPANEKRLPEVVKYVLENREALAAAISSMSIGTLKNVKSY